uniref:Myelin protein zero-like 1 like n=1 Tax=Oryzias latipes TaxID=8090 RepID=A0A3P9JG61_ORYLA
LTERDVFSAVTEQTCGLDVQADPEVIVQNGTTGVLRCSFKSSEVVTKRTTVTWKFQSNQPNSRFYDAPHVVSIFYFSDGQGYPGLEEFKERVQFIGDINKRDVSIQLSPTQFSDNGTFICDVKNPPDVSGTQAETLLRVVLKESLPQKNTGVIVAAVFLLLFIYSLPSSFVFLRLVFCESLTGRCGVSPPPSQGPVIYAQLDHSGSKNSFHKMEPVVYADIRKN